ncbi:MAG: DNA gyrase inhibitor YacG [Deltaproteobacteria bacterium]|nr:DNA gyrase inhibitor YacG [Deltaproteobacteria bacterium]
MKRTCPICNVEIVWTGNLWRPFCSSRCRLIDLGKWIRGDYFIPDKSISRESPPEEVEEKESSFLTNSSSSEPLNNRKQPSPTRRSKK